jgi:DNA-binding response OmpR family regulator/DNA-binding CsgD family transcriptional regulator
MTQTTFNSGVGARRVILVVDDAIDTLHMLCDALAREGYTVIVAKDAIEAWHRFEISVPDGVLLDAVMPGINGFEFCRQLKSTPHWSHVPVIFMTGLSETEQILEGFASGGVDYVVKPLRIPEVLARLSTHVSNARATRQAREAMDIAGRGLVVLDSTGRIAWRSPQALSWLNQAFPEDLQQTEQMAWLMSAEQTTEVHRPLSEGHLLVAQYLGESGLSEVTVLLSVMSEDLPRDNASESAVVRPRALPSVSLTPRETEVLSWLAKGKTNRDIADILGMSHRTVNKHLEHIFEKLGVETRTAAAAVASRLMN